MTNQNTALPSLATCLAVKLTDSDSENLNMIKAHVKATAEAPATAIERPLVGGNEVFSRFTSGNGFPLLATAREVASLTGEPMRNLGRGFCCGGEPANAFRVGFQFLTPNVPSNWRCASGVPLAQRPR